VGEAAFLISGLLVLLAVRAVAIVVEKSADEGVSLQDVELAVQNVPFWYGPRRLANSGTCAIHKTKTHLMITTTGFTNIAAPAVFQAPFIPLDKVVSVDVIEKRWPYPNLEIEYLDASQKFEKLAVRVPNPLELAQSLTGRGPKIKN
jgi:hypothetical protein